MRHQSIVVDIFADELMAELTGNANHTALMQLIKTELKSLSDTDAEKVCQLVKALAVTQDEDRVEIVTTTPVSFRVKTRKTRPVIEELLSSATGSIILTGYSISDHFEDFLRIIDNKSKQGVVVEMYVNSYDSVRLVLADIRHTNRKFFKIYEYAGKTGDKMAALHAKTVITDSNKMLISSANLSYHGLEGNIEIGALITSSKRVAQVLDIFADLKRQNVFSLVKN